MSFVEDRIGDPSLILQMTQTTPQTDDFIPLVSNRKHKNRKTKKQNDDELMLDYIRNCGLDDYTNLPLKIAKLSSTFATGVDNNLSSWESDDSLPEEGLFSKLKVNDDDQWEVSSADEDIKSEEIDDFIQRKLDLGSESESEDSSFDNHFSDSDYDNEDENDEDEDDEDGFIRKDFEGAISTWIDKPTRYNQNGAIMCHWGTCRKHSKLFELDGVLYCLGHFTNLSDQMPTKSATRKQAKQAKCDKRAKLSQEKLSRNEASQSLSKSLGNKSTAKASKGILSFLDDINLRIYSLVNSEQESTVLPPMPSEIKKMAVHLAKAYKTVPKMRGSGKTKVLCICVTGSSHIPKDWKLLPKSLFAHKEDFPTSLRSQPFTEMHGEKKGRGAKKKKGGDKVKKPKGASNNDSMPRIGDVVGSKAKPLDESNIGHKMLLKMGWKAGDSLAGNGTGIIEPITATIRSKRAGLGNV